MGSSFSKSYACLFVCKVESDFFIHTLDPNRNFKRFIDDCIGCTVMGTRDLHKFIDALGSANPNLKFTSTNTYKENRRNETILSSSWISPINSTQSP